MEPAVMPETIETETGSQTRTDFNAKRQDTRPPVPEDSIWSVLRKYEGAIKAPSDASVNLDHYLYGVPKRSEDGT